MPLFEHARVQYAFSGTINSEQRQLIEELSRLVGLHLARRPE
jgi:hypothetical protein